MSIVNTLNEELLKQAFIEERDEPAMLAECRHMAFMYSKIENSIAVLSDLKADKSYIYHGGVATTLGLSEKHNAETIDSIWEDEIFGRIHPEDLIGKHLLELRFFRLLRGLPINKRSDYYATSRIRMLDKNGQYVPIRHRMFYVGNSSNGSLWLALCLYNFAEEATGNNGFEGILVHSATGEIIRPDKEEGNQILTRREKEILAMIGQGKASKEIAELLSISLNTVNRHRQNILEKLRVKNSIEAYSLAGQLNLL